MEIDNIKQQTKSALLELFNTFPLDKRHILVIGCSTSEVMGQKIGSAGSIEIAEAIYKGILEVRGNNGFHLAFQGCEHINRALVIERETAEKFPLEIVTVVPVRKAGGAMATYAFSQMKDPVIVEFIKADAGIDIGNTLIGMHLKHVAVPLRSSIKKVGEANITMAITRPKLIGGARAQYNTDRINLSEINNDGESC